MKVSGVTIDTEVFDMLVENFRHNLEASNEPMPAELEELYSQFRKSYRTALARTHKANSLKKAKRKAQWVREMKEEKERSLWGRA